MEGLFSCWKSSVCGGDLRARRSASGERHDEGAAQTCAGNCEVRCNGSYVLGTRRMSLLQEAYTTLILKHSGRRVTVMTPTPVSEHGITVRKDTAMGSIFFTGNSLQDIFIRDIIHKPVLYGILSEPKDLFYEEPMSSAITSSHSGI